MTPERLCQIRNLFETVVHRPPQEQDAFLQEACRDDPELRSEVAKLLSAHAHSPQFMETPIVESHSFPVPELLIHMEGRRIGAYQIVREIGRGGMGKVYLAERADRAFQKQVALKMVRAGPGAEEILRRFLQEREILASLDHPHIARLLDGGTTEDEIAYLVMEYVEGTAIVEHCNARRLNITARLELFQVVCEAIAYAHQHGVVHRDLKPSNILVTKEGEVKVLDFGIAKLLRTGFEETVLETRQGLLLMTPEYASPEQVKGEPITFAADVYVLGVLLYELLTGCCPYRLKSRLIQEVARAICDEEPTRPSAVVTLAGANSKDEAHESSTDPEQISAVREGNVTQLKRRLAGDLDHILLQALRKEPERRYRSVGELREDITRHLKSVPVRARKIGVVDRTRKLLARNKRSLVLALLTAMSVILLAIAAQVAAHRIRTDRDQRTLTTALEATLSAAADPSRIPMDKLHMAVLRDPTGKIATLAKRATIRVDVQLLPNLDPASEAPNVRLAVRRLFDIGQPAPVTVQFEGRYDNGSWRPLRSMQCSCDAQRPGISSETSFGALFGQYSLSPDFHRLEFRANITGEGFTENRQAGTFDLRAVAGMSASYPTALSEHDCRPTILQGFRLDRVLITEMISQTSLGNDISKIELFGRFDARVDCPVIGELSIYDKGQANALLRIPIAVGGGIIRLGLGFSYASQTNPGIRAATYIRMDSSGRFQLRTSRKIAVGATKGLAEFQPSQSLARHLRLFDRYLAVPLRFPIEIVVRHAEGG
jgi:hypothetical protein